MTNRKQFLTIVGGSLLQLSVLGQAHGQVRPRRIGILSPYSRGLAVERPLAELKKLGWTDGDNMVLLEPRLTEGRNERLPGLAAELVAEAPDVILVHGLLETLALMKATQSIPLVMSFTGNPVETGVVKSLARPGGNVTGSTYVVHESGVKLMGLLKEAVPRLLSVAVYVNPTVDSSVKSLRLFEPVVAALGMRLQVVEVSKPADFEPAFAAIRQEKTESIMLFPEPFISTKKAAIGEFAQRHRLPLARVGTGRALPAGGLIAYGPSIFQYFQIAARQVDRILKGAKPGDLPVERPTRFELTVNKKTAESIGITIPSSIMLRADKIIE